jgi:inner membrane protein
LDTITHALSGALLARAVTARPTQAPSANELRWFGPRVPVWQAMTVGLVAAAFPDSDAVLKYVSDLAYLRGHRGVTHSVTMLPLWALLLGGILALLFRRRDAFKRYTWLAGASIAIHIAGDWITQFGTMLLAPFSDARFGLGSVFIIDLVLSGIVLAGLLASLLFRASRVPATAALALLPVWVGVTMLGKSEATAFGQQYARANNLVNAKVDAAPRPGSPFNWTVVVETENSYRVAHINTRRSDVLTVTEGSNFIRRFSAPYLPLAQARWEPMAKFGNASDEGLARTVWSHPDFAFFRWFAMFPQLYRVDAAAGADTCVWWRDLRFIFPGRNDPPFRFGMCRNGQGQWASYALDDIAGRAALR